MGAAVDLVTLWQALSEDEGVGKSRPARGDVDRTSTLCIGQEVVILQLSHNLQQSQDWEG
jgi:hypothetical protein